MEIGRVTLGKKGLFFTLIAITIMAALIAFFMPQQEYYPQITEMPTVRTRVIIANNFLSGLESSLLQRVLAEAGYGALKSLAEYVYITRLPLENVQASFSEIILNGTINKGQNLTTVYGIYYMEGKTIRQRLRQFEEMAEENLRLDTNLTILNVSIYQSDETGYMFVGMNLTVGIQLDAGIAFWNTTHTTTAMIGILGLRDPYYLINANYTNLINFTNITSWTDPLVFDLIDSQGYVFDEDGPSLLSRLANDSHASYCCGIESFINPIELNITLDIPLSYVDHCYYGLLCNGSAPGAKSLWNISGITAGNETEKFYAFKLDVYHIKRYNLTADKRVVQEPAGG